MKSNADPSTPPRSIDRIALGGTFYDHLTNADKYPALVIGSDRWSKDDLGRELGIVQTKAAAILSAVCRRLKVKDVAHLYASTSPYTFADVEHRAGVTTLFVMFAVFRARKLDLGAWYRQGATEGQALTSFEHFKARELAAEARTRQAKKK